MNQNETSPFPIVGVGASAGGLEAFQQFLSSLPDDTGMGFVLIQHLDPTHESMSTEILSRSTKMPVSEVRDLTRIIPNHIYVIPSNVSLEILQGVLSLSPRPMDHGRQKIIDIFFKSLAQDQRELAIGVVLSGTGADGTEGLDFIKSKGGITIAQEPGSAKFKDMPKNAIASGVVDLVLAPGDIASRLAHIASQKSIFANPTSKSDGNEEIASPMFPADALAKIFLLLRKTHNVDFSFYKPNTIHRRLLRRMTFHHMNDLHVYYDLLTKNPEEGKALYEDILIHVTSFFRDPEAYEALVRDVFPRLVKDRLAGQAIRIWIPACSTGEEVYSVAIALLEFLGERSSDFPLQIFASDISEEAITKARAGLYPESIGREVSESRLKNFFIHTDTGQYKISKSIRDICYFSRHDITVDPPLAKMDLISCRNLLIYLTPETQRHVIPIFHYALKAGGLLWLGLSETTGGFSNLFNPIDKTHKTYGKINVPSKISLNFRTSTYIPNEREMGKNPQMQAPMPINLDKVSEIALQNEYPGVLINGEMEIIQFRGRTAPFIEPASGIASYHLTKMVRPEIKAELRRLVLLATKKKSSVYKEGMSIQEGDKLTRFNLKVLPITPISETSQVSGEEYYLILFENQTTIEASKSKKKIGTSPEDGKGSDSSEATILELQKELLESQEYQSSLIEKYEASREDHSTANEELQSINEELQSTNEELETAKEELQSTNEELSTVNDELQNRSIEQMQLSNDLINLLGSVQIPILMLGNDHSIRRFTPLAASALNLLQTDVGRPISDLKLNFSSPETDLDLDQLVTNVLEQMSSKELEVQDTKGKWFKLQVRPYKTIDNKIDGAVLAWIDIDTLKNSLKEAKEAKAEADRANKSKDLFLATLSHELRTPLTSILSWTQLILRGKLDAERTEHGLHIIEDNAKVQAQLINDLLDVSRIILGKFSLTMEKVNTQVVLQAAIDSVLPTATSKSIRIETYYEPQIPDIMADPLRLQQIFWNLLSNAVKFSSPESFIVVRLTKFFDNKGINTEAMIQVIDSGKGIDPEFIPHIFDKFSQEDSSSIKLHGGLGLGLAIVKNLVELHGGVIRVEASEGKPGATFTVNLPIKEKAGKN
jgi:two-component system, chemotaxis family, CheB/CheR fusion protein